MLPLLPPGARGDLTPCTGPREEEHQVGLIGIDGGGATSAAGGSIRAESRKVPYLRTTVNALPPPLY